MANLSRVASGRRTEPMLLQRIAANIPGIGRYTAGPLVEDAVAKMEKLSGQRIKSIANILGEHDQIGSVIVQTKLDYMELIRQIAERKINGAAISLKPTQFGLSFSDEENGVEIAAGHIIDICREAVQKGIFVWLDMENRFTTNFTLASYQKLNGLYPGMIGVALQANLKRTERDLCKLLRMQNPISIRLIRGIYDEPEEFAYVGRTEMHRSLAYLMEVAFSQSGDNLRLSIGTHHPDQIVHALKLNKQYPNRLSEFQFLLGAVKKIPLYLSELGYTCTYYVPCGPRFLDYGIRRIKENPGGLIGLFASSLYERSNMGKIVDHVSGRVIEGGLERLVEKQG